MLLTIGICYLQLLLVEFAESAAPIANSVFKQMSTVPWQWGSWDAYTKCELAFSGQTVPANTGYILIKFSVPITDYKDYISANNPVDQDVDNRWVIISPKHTYSNSLDFELEFAYNMFLGADIPQGACKFYLSLVSATNSAANSGVVSTPADPKLDSLPFSVHATTDVSHSKTQLYLKCQFTLASGIRFGANEGFALLTSSVPFEDYTDYWGPHVVQTAADKTWIIARNPHNSNHNTQIDYDPVITVDKDDVSGISGTCELWVEETDCISYAQNLTSTATTTPQYTTTTPTPTTTTPAAATTTTTTTTTTTPAATTTTLGSTSITSLPPSWTTLPMTSTTTTSQPAVTTATSTAVSPCALSGTADCLREVTTMRDTLVATGGTSQLWSVPSLSDVGCGRRCLNDVQCVSVFYSSTDSRCIGHSSVYTSGPSTLGVKYYVRE